MKGGDELLRVFEVSNKKSKNGKRWFKAVLHRIYPDSCVDDVNQVGTESNLNGITWIREYCEKALPTIKGMSLRCEFIDDERTEIHGHGYTDRADGDPLFENASVIGTFTKGYIDEIEDNTEGKILVCIGEGEIDALCYHSFVEKLDEKAEMGVYPYGSVEILHTDNNKEIIYKYGYKEEGRIPVEFNYSGYALLGIPPADESARIIEFNEEEQYKEDLMELDRTQVEEIVKQTIKLLTDKDAEFEAFRKECNEKIDELNKVVDTITKEKEEIQKNTDDVTAVIEEKDAQIADLQKKVDELTAENEELKAKLVDKEAKEKVDELNKVLDEFNEDEIAYAEEEIKTFKEDPLAGDIDVIVDIILKEIGKAAKADADEKKAADEQNAHRGDIFEEMHLISLSNKYDMNIF